MRRRLPALSFAVRAGRWLSSCGDGLDLRHCATDDANERARRQDRLQWAVTTWDPLPLDIDAARAYGRVFAATRASGRSSRTRLADLLIAAIGVANGLDLYTRSPGDLIGLEHLLRIIEV